MDMLRESSGLRAFAEKDPRIEYKTVGTELFAEFQKSIRDKITDIIFKVRLSQNFVMKNVYSSPVETFQQPQSYGVGGSMAAQQAQAEMAEAGGGGGGAITTNAAPEERVTTIINDGPKVGRN